MPQNRIPRVLIAALRGGAGKTILTVGIIAALARKGKVIAPFKKGPDYIDAGWLALSAGRPCYNLDTFLVPDQSILESFLRRSQNSDISVIEGNRGLYDGIDVDGRTSTAELAKLLNCPVVLCLDCTKSTRTMAAVVLGCLKFDPDLMLKGVVLNRVAGSRHRKNTTQNIEHHTGVPVLGAVPKLEDQNFPERHMGLIPTHEHHGGFDSVSAIAEVAAKYIDLEAIEALAEQAPPMNFPESLSGSENRVGKTQLDSDFPAIGVIKDSAFQFYYPDNIDALRSAGAKVVFISPLADKTIPDVDALYIGGGFPETHAEILAEKEAFRNSLKLLADQGLPIYAECGGLMYLGEELILEGRSYPMAGVLPLAFGLCKKPQGHGYTVFRVEEKNPFYEVGTEIKGHEFHYSSVLKCPEEKGSLVFSMKRGIGIKDRRDGAVYKNVLATYTHVHALGSPEWAEALVKKAREYKKIRSASGLRLTMS